MSRRHPSDLERQLPNRRRKLIELLEALAPYVDDPYEEREYCDLMMELRKVERRMHVRPSRRYENRH